MADSTKISNTLRPPCSRCGKPTILTRIEQEQPYFGLRIFYCASCAACDRVIATADVNDGSLGPVCTENSNPDVMMVNPTEDRV
jgi:hypothetical protein